MAASNSKPAANIIYARSRSHGHGPGPGPTPYHFSRLRLRPPTSLSFNFKSQNTKTGPAFSVRGCAEGYEDFGVTEEDHYFVNTLRESQPYVSVHRGRLFVLLISAELVAAPSLLSILQVGTRCHSWLLTFKWRAFYEELGTARKTAGGRKGEVGIQES
ncbi:hypothetical protein VNO78_08064 [Psophocarpus tetragonolobus]|uniref:Uncharacterized protein n=1 Tax=Psophocarpus tetragonolobus TaxID=3891 RepID=A0AAN9SVC8_PSOTE